MAVRKPYRVIQWATGYTIRADFPLGLPGGTGASFSDAMAMTAARAVNAIPAVVAATPGYKQFLDLTAFAACGSMAAAGELVR